LHAAGSRDTPSEPVRDPFPRISVAKPQQKSISEIGQELVELLREYARQQTLDPLKALGTYLAWGAGGALLMAGGLFFLSLALLRALQTETNGTFSGVWSWAPYLIVAVVLAGVIALATWRITHGGNSEHAGAT
jgi:hypothetical protein